MFNCVKDVINYVKQNNIAGIDFKACDIDGKWKHLTVPSVYATEEVMTEGLGIDGSNYGFKGVHRSDMVIVPDISTGFRDPFWKIPTLSFICDVHETDDSEQRCLYDPRFICEKAENFVLSLGVGDKILLGPEFEFYVFDRVSYGESSYNSYFDVCSYSVDPSEGNIGTGYKAAVKGAYHAEQPLDRLASFRACLCEELHNMGVKVKYHHHEVGGPGQMEIETDFGTVKAMADISMKIKYAVKNFAVQNSLTATFMPKPMFGVPGSGFHVHFKMLNRDSSVFYDSCGYANMSKTALQFITGILVHARALSAIVNPSINSYKRLVPGYEAPVSVVFAQANRSAAIRIPGYAKTPQDKRFEYRAGDASANPYLMFAALVMAGADGIIRELDCGQEHVGPIDGNIFELSNEEKKTIKSLPASLSEAADALESDYEFLLRGNVFSEMMIKSWISAKRKESNVLRPQPCEYEMYYDC